MSKNFKTINLSGLEDKFKENTEYLNSIYSELRRVQEILKGGVIKPFKIKMDNRLLFYWNKEDRRLWVIFDGLDRPILEHKVEGRIYAFNFLEKFVSELKNQT